MKPINTASVMRSYLQLLWEFLAHWDGLDVFQSKATCINIHCVALPSQVHAFVDSF